MVDVEGPLSNSHEHHLPICESHKFDLKAKTVATPNTAMQVEPFLSLPTELVALIFEVAALDSKATAASLALVSRFSRSLVLPLSFRTILLHSRGKADRLSCFLQSNLQIASHIRELWMPQSIDSDSRIVLSCVKLERLALTPACLSALLDSVDRAASQFSGNMVSEKKEACRSKPISLCAPYEVLIFPGYVRWGDHLNSPYGPARFLFQGVTHLWLTQASQLSQLLAFQKMLCNVFPRLSHVAAPLYAFVEITIQDLLNAIPTIQTLVLTRMFYQDPWSRHRRTNSQNINCILSRDAHASHFGRVYILDKSQEKEGYRDFEWWKDNIWRTVDPVHVLD